MIILKTGTKGKSVKDLAIEVLAKCGSIQNFKKFSVQKLIEIDGIGKVKAIEICGMIELFRGVYHSVNEQELILFNNPGIIIEYFNNLFLDLKQEEFYCVYLNQKKK